MAARVTQQSEEPEQAEAEEESQVTRAADLGFNIPSREIEVEPIREAPVKVDDQGFVVIRMSETIEEFTYGNPHIMFNLERGKRYRVPVHIAQYLDSLGYVYH